MRKFLSICNAIFFCCFFAAAQQQPSLKFDEQIYVDTEEQVIPVHSIKDAGVTTKCSDTVLYPFAKRSANRGIFVNDTTSAQALGQWYDAPQPIKVHGFEFFAYQSQTGNSTPVIVNCNLYRAGGNFTPTGNPIASASVLVPTSPTTSLNVIRKTAEFAVPVTVNFPYILTVETTSNLNVTVYTNNWDASDGKGEYLACGRFGNYWYRGDNINVGSANFDADVYLQPYVSYDMQVDFDQTTHCIDGDDTLQFLNLSSPILESRFYNQKAFDDTGHSGHLSYSWDFSDGSPIEHVFNTEHIFGTAQKYVITLTDSLVAWKNTFVGVKKDSIDQQPVASFSHAGFNHDIQFFNTSTGNDQWLWKFENDLYTRLETPWFHFLNVGVHDVTLYVENACGTDSITQQVTVYGVGIDNKEEIGITTFPNPANDLVEINCNSQAPTSFDIVLYDLMGNAVLSEKAEFHAASKVSLGVSELPTGIYFMVISNEDSHYSNKFVISR